MQGQRDTAKSEGVEGVGDGISRVVQRSYIKAPGMAGVARRRFSDSPSLSPPPRALSFRTRSRSVSKARAARI